jgi:putative protease
MKKPELLAPAGSFAAASQAFEAGADGVYLGLTEFSARRAAPNFSLEQLKRIRGLAQQRNHKVYVTVNTVIREEEMRRVASLCAWLEFLQVDGVIVQDLGTCVLLTRGFPSLPIHASTQMAIHNDSGLRFAEELGIRRVILSRELPLERIRSLRRRHPGIELEVFIHGALCYSFSGICLASWALTGRSGNRGDCAQICRSVFCSGENSKTSPFSCRDLSLGTEILKLADAGVDSLKIEGRMKSPEYVFHVTKLYRTILDRGSSLSQAEMEELEKNADTTFSREKTKAYFHSPRGENLLTTMYPGHRGVLLGTVTQVRGREIGLRLQARLSLHDGMGYWRPAAKDPVIFAVRAVVLAGKRARYAEAGDTVFIPIARETPMPDVGTEVRLFSSRFLDRPVFKESGVPLFRISIYLEVTLREEAGAGTLACRVESGGNPFTFTRKLQLMRSTGGKSFEGILRKLLGEPINSLFALRDLSFVNETGRSDTEIFVPPSELKKARNEIIAALDGWLLSEVDCKAQAALDLADPQPGSPTPAHLMFPLSELSKISHRNLLSPPAGQPLPFAAITAVQQGPAVFSSYGGFFFVPLPPVILDDEVWLEALQGLSDTHPLARFAIGLNNVGHLDLADRLAGRENCFFFADYCLYVANCSTLSFLAARTTKLLFLYSWIEGEGRIVCTQRGPSVAGTAVVTIAKDYRPPLFYSLGCYERHALSGGRCRDECPKQFTGNLEQGRNRFTVVVNDCITYLFQTQKEQRHAGIS